MSLLTVIIAFGIIGFLALVLATSFKNNLTANSAITDKAEVEDLRRMIRIAMNCPATLAALPQSCPEGTPVVIMKKTTVLIEKGSAKHQTVLGGKKLRASCTATPNTFNIEFGVGKQGKASWQALFKVPVSC